MRISLKHLGDAGFRHIFQYFDMKLWVDEPSFLRIIPPKRHLNGGWCKITWGRDVMEYPGLFVWVRLHLNMYFVLPIINYRPLDGLPREPAILGTLLNLFLQVLN